MYDKCNSIVINKERLMTVTVDENNRTKHEFSPLYPTYFSPSAARQIVEGDLYSDCNGNRIKRHVLRTVTAHIKFQFQCHFAFGYPCVQRG